MSTVIKAGATRAVSGGALRMDLRDFSARAEAMLAAARAQAEEILARARDEAASLGDQARRDGYEKGLSEGRAAGQSEGREAALAEARQQFAADQASLVTTLTALTAELRERREKLYAAARRDVIVLAMTIARRVAGKLSRLDDEAAGMAAQACQEALAVVSTATRVTVRVHPADAAVVATLSRSLSEAMGREAHLGLVEDEKVGRGGVILETPESIVDATLAGRLDRIADELITAWRGRISEQGMDS